MEETCEPEGDDDEDEEERRIQKRNRQIAKEDAQRQKKSSSIVATCGGNTVCFIDCRLGKVMTKYSHVEEEDFMCLAWTTLDHSYDDSEEEGDKDAEEDRREQSNILAVAGRLGSIKLINPLQNTCYKYLHGHTETILQLKFSLTNPRWLFSASTDGTARLWDIGSLTNYEKEACCLAKFVGLDDSSVTAIGVSEKYLIVGTEKGLMAQYNLFELSKEIERSQQAMEGKRQTHSVKPERIYPPSQEWHESSVDEINEDGDNNDDMGDGEFVFASRENCQGEILVWDASKSTETDAELKTILEWSISESWTKFTLAENMIVTSKKKGGAEAPLQRRGWEERRQNVLVAGSTDGKIVLFDLGRKPKRARDGNIVAAKPSAVSPPGPARSHHVLPTLT
ncbi:WD40-repeat-containing domain protein [Dissophora ornata]|nr:WD40-repeat-containing domain protein [Dissophora ornata]